MNISETWWGNSCRLPY